MTVAKPGADKPLASGTGVSPDTSLPDTSQSDKSSAGINSTGSSSQDSSPIVLLKPRRGLFILLFALFGLWFAAMVVMYFATVRPNHHQPAASTSPI